MAIFKTRARALDMLGRQQIAGIPTAINELFKNAHDAYADRVELDYFRQEKIVLIRDDGFGMTMKDFLSRWLVLGTESKVDGSRSLGIKIPHGKRQRPILGEKGIGRLSVASIGKQVLIISRAQENDVFSPIVCALINWSLFEIPGIDLDQINIPVKELTHYPTRDDIRAMVSELETSIYDLVVRGIIYKNEAAPIISDCQEAIIDTDDLFNRCPIKMSLDNATGTHFFITCVYNTLDDTIDGNQEDRSTASKLEKFLIGFSNTMTPGHPQPEISVAFRDHISNDIYNDLIDKDSFFTPDDFVAADHHCVGHFDEFGQFTGKVTIYNTHTLDHKITWSGNSYKKTACGPFEIEFSYLQGAVRQSSVDPIKHAMLKDKLDKFGGLYIYKDNIRILPYGNNDYDFLDIELNRTKSAAYYFFSYRRIFGVINISRKDNSALIEKAGREGLIENKAYKQMRDILKNFFVQLAGDFFRESEKGGGANVELWESLRREHERIFQAKEKREKRIASKKSNFIAEINTFFDRCQKNFWEQETERILQNSYVKLTQISHGDDFDSIADRLILEENFFKKSLNSLRDIAKIQPPHGFTLTREQRENFEAYLSMADEIEAHYFIPAEKKIVEKISEIKQNLSLVISNKKRVQQSLDLVSEDAKTVTAEKKKTAQKVAQGLLDKIRTLTTDLMGRLEGSVRDAHIKLSSLTDDTLSDDDLLSTISQIEAPIVAEKDKAISILESIVAQIESIYWDRDGEGKFVTNEDIANSLEEEIEDLRHKTNSDAELIQLGLAVNIIHHEFANSVRALRNSIRTLRDKASIDKTLVTTYNNLSTNFSHLDHYLSMLTPFSRRIKNEPEDINTQDVFLFMLDVFSGRLKRHNIECRRTGRFAQGSIHACRSIIYPVFANLVDNAIHWLKQSNVSPKIIRLHIDEAGNMFVSNNGPVIPIQDMERIFELGFTRKPNGRGMGLTISREILKSAGFMLTACCPKDPDMTVSFKITPIASEENRNA